MRVFFVIDLMNGRVVAAERGEREKYRPVAEKSEIVETSDAVELVKAVKPKYLYAADLDSIMGRGTNVETLIELSRMVDEMIFDAGVASINDLEALRGVDGKVILPTETFDLYEIRGEDVSGYYISLDFLNEKLLDASGRFREWRDAVEFVNTLNPEGVIVLTLGNVGTLSPNFELVENVINVCEHPVLLGGGIGGIDDLLRAKEIGCSGVLVSTAVHRRKIPVEVIQKGKI